MKCANLGCSFKKWLTTKNGDAYQVCKQNEANEGSNIPMDYRNTLDAVPLQVPLGLADKPVRWKE
jgi:hypothetical protein